MQEFESAASCLQADHPCDLSRFLHYAIEQPSKDEDGLTSKPPGHGFHSRTLHFSPNRIAPHSQKHTVHLTGTPRAHCTHSFLHPRMVY